MALPRETLILLILVVFIAGLVKVIEFFQTNVIESDASNFVMEDLHSKYPRAQIEIISVSANYNEAGDQYFEVKAKVTNDAHSPCPQRSHFYYNYPTQNFVAQPPEVITKGCSVCEVGICTIAFPEEAIIASHTFEGTGEVSNYLKANQDAVPLAIEDQDRWRVIWDSRGAGSYYVVSIHRTGKIVQVTRMIKDM